MTHPGKNNAPARALAALASLPLGNLRRDALWRENDLMLYGRPIASVVPDAKWLGMWRVHCAGKVSDMVNLTRAKDAAKSIALAELNGVVAQ